MDYLFFKFIVFICFVWIIFNCLDGMSGKFDDKD